MFTHHLCQSQDFVLVLLLRVLHISQHLMKNRQCEGKTITCLLSSVPLLEYKHQLVSLLS